MTAQFHSFVTRLLVAAVLGFAASSAADAATIQLRAWLNGEQVPLVVSGMGLGIVTFDTVTKVVTWSVSYQSLTSNCTDAHFHGPAAAGVNNSPTVPMGCSGGSNPLTGSSAPLNATQEAQLLSGQWYINIHTEMHSDGEIRGQVLVVRGDLDGDGQSDVVWRNISTGDNYLYPMNGTAIFPSEGYLRQVADQNWQIAGIGDFDGDGKSDILWRNSVTGENYIYLMNGKDIAGEGYIRTVADQNWQVAGVGDVNGDGRADILWRNSSSGENYIYLMNATSIAGEGYLRTVADQNWRVVGVSDFNGDGRADILWRNSSSGENYIYPMDGLTIKLTEGYLRTVADQNWRVVGVADFDGDGRSDILWRNSSTGEDYIYPMAGLTILPTEGYIRTVADQNWRVARLGDYDGDGRSDILWRNAMTGENYLYPMDGTTINPTEGYIRTVPDQNWKTPLTTFGLEFPSNHQVTDGQTVRFKFTNPHTTGLPIYGPGGNGVTYIFKVFPKQQTGYYTTFFWGNDDGKGNLDTFFWKNNLTQSDTYYGAHPYPDIPPNGTTHSWEISVDGGDVVNGAVEYGRWHTQALRVWRDADTGNKHHQFYWDLPSTDPGHVVTYVAPATYAEMNPPQPALTFGDAPWRPGEELCSCILRGIQIYSSLLSLTDIQQEITSPLSTTAGSGSIWYLNLDPTPTDISDKSGRGNHPVWVGPLRPGLWSQ